MSISSGTPTNTFGEGISSLDVNHEVEVGTDCLVIFVTTQASSGLHPAHSSVTYGATSLTKQADVLSSTSQSRASVWVLVPPSPGTASAEVTLSDIADTVSITVIDYTGVEQTDPVGATATVSGSLVALHTTGITTTAPNSLVVGGDSSILDTASPFTPGTGVTEILDGNTGSGSIDHAFWFGELFVETASAQTFEATADVASVYALVAMELLATPSNVALQASEASVSALTGLLSVTRALTGPLASTSVMTGKISGAGLGTTYNEQTGASPTWTEQTGNAPTWTPLTGDTPTWS